MADKSNGKNTGKIVEIKGVVLDAVFPERLPEIFHALKVEIPEDGGTRELIAEVQQHLGDDRVRAVAMDSTDGLARGSEIVDTQEPISVPVGDQSLGRIWNVIGDPVDGKHDDLPEQAFYMVGTIEEAVERAKQLTGDDSAPESEPETDAEAAPEPEPEPEPAAA